MNIEAFSERVRDAALRDAFRISHYGKIGELELPVFERFAENRETAPNVYISTGVHGDEPAGPMALLEILRAHALPKCINLTLFPLINPTGLAVETRENAEGVDLNRDYGSKPDSEEIAMQIEWLGDRKFDLSICMHEDSDGEGFYLYSHIDYPTETDYPGLAIEAASAHTGIDTRTLIDDMPARDGRMFPPESVIDGFGDNLPEALWLTYKHNSRFTFTTETPSKQSILNRIGAHRASVCAILGAFFEELPLD